MKTQLVALKNFTYGRCRLRKGQAFAASRADARLLVAIAHAAHTSEPLIEVRKVITAQAKPVEVTKPSDAGLLDTLRAEFLALAGTHPDRRWGTARLSSEIAMLKGKAENADE